MTDTKSKQSDTHNCTCLTVRKPPVQSLLSNYKKMFNKPKINLPNRHPNPPKHQFPQTLRFYMSQSGLKEPGQAQATLLFVLY